jgi:hypothetical protein
MAHDLYQEVPFEVCMEALRRALGRGRSDDPIGYLLGSIYDSGTANENHRTIRERIGTGLDVVMTTNFDRLIEDGVLEAISSEAATAVVTHELMSGSASPTNKVIHLHGAVRDPAGFDAYQRRVGRPLAGARATLFSWVRSRRALVVVGYSGSDLDIRPYLERVGQPVVWLKRSRPSWLGRSHDFIPVELDPTARTDHAERLRRRNTQETISRWSEQSLVAADRLAIAAALASLAGEHVIAARLSRRAFAIESSPAIRLAFAASQSGLALYGRAAAALRPGPEASAVPGEVIADRAFYRRSSADVPGALADLRLARGALEVELADRHDVAPELLDVLWRIAEGLLLLASGARREKRMILIAGASEAIAQATVLVGMNPTVVDYINHFCRAELALLEGRFDEAILEYTRYRDEGAAWRDQTPRLVAPVRIAAARGAKRQYRRAWSAWLDGAIQAWNARSLVHMTQYVLGAPVILGFPAYLWWLRRLATRLYPRYEWFKAIYFRATARGDAIAPLGR